MGGNTWSNNQYVMSDGGGRFQWGGSENFTQFKDAAKGEGRDTRGNSQRTTAFDHLGSAFTSTN